ncbi:carbohydrate porin [Rubellicoccus peritrichatus]|uniref:Carbohydrate porin n=1 Tax=Rubellicoccus peritrichatus TaxID=3080537 RepID=A0AAQ3LB01_9BACT|nr:carbohydrate porin [Puniceicoccus sp. CR14]WOO41952.1 carbohydrate porin [Puniceicoccus sp. CR14]
MKIRFSDYQLIARQIISSMMIGFAGMTSTAAEETSQGLAAESTLIQNAFGKDFINQSGLTGDWWGAGQTLEKWGLSPFATLTGEFLANASGGIDEGSAWGGLLDLGMEVNFEPSLGLEGTSFFVNAFAFHGNDVSGNYVGDFNVVSNIFTTTDFNVFNLYLKQSFQDDHYWAKAGQIAADDDFMVSDTALLFMNSAFGPLPTESGNVAAPIYPLAAPGALAYIEPIEGWYFQTAVYAGDAGPATPSNRGFDWRAGGSAGVAWFAETGYHYQLAGKGVLKAGGYYATGEYQNFATSQTERGFGAFYGIINHEFLDTNEDAFGLSVFGRASLAPEEELATVYAYVDAGIKFDSLFLKDDAFGVAVSNTWFGNDYVSDSRQNGTSVSDAETIVEVTYQILITEWAAIQPDFQWIIDPHFSQRNAVVAGIRASINL